MNQTAADMRAACLTAEQKINAALREFEDASGVSVKRVELVRVHAGKSLSTPCVMLDVNLGSPERITKQENAT